MILKFNREIERDEFLHKVQLEREDIFQRISPAKRLPHIVVEEVDDEQAKWLDREVSNGGGETFADVKFDLF